MALVTFLATVWKSSTPGVTVWRNSTLPLVFMRVVGAVDAVEGEEHEDATNDVDMKMLEERARKVKGRVSVEDRDVRLVVK
jgi:uncharacterized linocin/CFP29 family protein